MLSVVDLVHIGGYEIDWGDVGGWVSGLGTLGTLAVALRVLTKDRRREERAQAAKVVTWTTWVKDEVQGPEAKVCEVHLSNRSEAPIFSPDIHVVPLRRSDLSPHTSFRRREELQREHGYVPSRRRQRSEVMTFVFEPRRAPRVVTVEPGQTVSGDLGTWSPLDMWDILVSFRDANGVDWIRNVRTAELRTPPPKHLRHRVVGNLYGP